MSYAIVGLENPKFHENVGSVMRAAGNFDAQAVLIQGSRYGGTCKTDTMKNYKSIPLFSVPDLSQLIPLKCTPVAVELLESAVSITNYKHPKQAFYIFGPEDGDISEELQKVCTDKIYIPTNRCLNLAATVNVVLYDRMCKLR